MRSAPALRESVQQADARREEAVAAYIRVRAPLLLACNSPPVAFSDIVGDFYLSRALGLF